MALVDFTVLLFACWTVAYHITLASRLPAIYAYGLFVLLAVPAALLITRMRRGLANVVPGTKLETRLVHAGILALGTLSAYLSTLVSRPDWDDLGFFHRALVQYGHMDAPFFRVDTMHNITGLTVVSPVHLMTSWEMASAFTSRPFGMDPVVFYHNVACAAAAFLVPVVYYLLYRTLGLERWKSLAASFGAVIFLWYDGNLHHSFGNMSFVRLYQGKAVFFTVLVPLLFVFALRYIKVPRLYSWLMLFLACVCGAGLSSSALFICPAILFVLSTSHLSGELSIKGRDFMPLLKEFFILNFAGIYCIILLLLSYGTMGYYMSRAEEQATWWASVGTVTGGGWSLAWYGLLLFAVPLLALDVKWRRFWVFYSLGLVVIFFNPVTGPLWARVVSVYSRFVYLLPLPMCAGLAAALMASLPGRVQDRRYFRAGYILLAVLVLCGALAYKRPTFSKLDYVFYKAPLDYKFDQPVLAFCRAASGIIRGRNLLAPEEVAVVSPLLDGSLRLEAARELYTVELFSRAGMGEEGLRRRRAQDFVESGGTGPDNAAAFDTSIRGGVDAVVARSGVAPMVQDELGRLPGQWSPAYNDGLFALFIKG